MSPLSPQHRSSCCLGAWAPGRDLGAALWAQPALTALVCRPPLLPPHSLASSTAGEEGCDLWPGGLPSPTIYYALRAKQLEHQYRYPQR